MPQSYKIEIIEQFVEQDRPSGAMNDLVANSLEAVREVWFNAPVDLGQEYPNPDRLKSLRERYFPVVDPVEFRQYPAEFQAASIWLDLVMLGEQVGAVPEQDLVRLTAELVDIAGRVSWEPAQAWVYRALVSLGQRRTLAMLLPESPPYTLPQAEAFLEAQFSTQQMEQLPVTFALAGAIKSDFPGELAGSWIELLRTETLLFEQPQDDHLLSVLLNLAGLDHGADQPDWYRSEILRLRGRARAAVLRAGLARTSGGEYLQIPESGPLPGWEISLLSGLVLIRQDHHNQAEELLRHSLSQSPRQSPVRYALGFLLADRFPYEAFEILNGKEVTWQGEIARIALLVRSRKLDGADDALEVINEKPSEALRWRWKQTDRLLDRQKNLLMAAYQTRKGDFSSAKQRFSSTLSGESENVLRLAKEALSTWYALQGENNVTWDAERNRQRLRGATRNLFRVKTSEADASTDEINFIKAILVNDRDNGEKSASLDSLFDYRTWLSLDRKLGLLRLHFITDAYLESGDLEKVRRIPALLEKASDNQGRTEDPWLIQNEVRAFLVRLYRLWLDHASEMQIGEGNFSDEQELTRAADLLLAVTPGFPATAILTAVMMILIGSDRATEYIQKAWVRGAESDVCDLLEMLYQGVLDPSCLDAALEAEDELPKCLAQMLKLIRACTQDSSGSIEDFDLCLRDFIHQQGTSWIDALPFDGVWMMRKLITTAVEQRRWDIAHQWADRLRQTCLARFPSDEVGSDGVVTVGTELEDISTRTHLLVAVETAIAGDFESAKKDLAEVRGG